MQKFRIGNFEGWLVGKMQWQVRDRRTGAVVDTAESMSECARKAERLNIAAESQQWTAETARRRVGGTFGT